MTEKQRLLQVLAGKTPDRVPWFADLGHWFQAESGDMWNLFQGNQDFEGLIALHREVKAGWYIGSCSLHEESYGDSIERVRDIQGDRAVERYQTAKGSLTMVRRWNPLSYSWDIEKHLVESPQDLIILKDALNHLTYRPHYDDWINLSQQTDDIGLCFPNLAYTGLGSLISYYMGVENTVYALIDEPELTESYIQLRNEKQMELVRIYSQSPAPHMIFSDNLSSDVQSPDLFRRYSLDHYKAIADCLHAKNKTVSAHIDGRMRGLIGMLAQAGIDIADACTPKPSGDLSPREIREEAGHDMILMGGIAPVMWLPETPEKTFIEHVRAWLDLRLLSSRLVQSAGDQVPPGTSLQRIKLMAELVDTYGRYPESMIEEANQ